MQGVQHYKTVKCLFEQSPTFCSKEEKMSLGKVVHQLSTDHDFAAQWKTDPEGTLAKQGLRLTNEELAFLKVGLKRREATEVRLSDLMYKLRDWA